MINKRPAGRDLRAPVNFFIKVEIVLVEQSVQEIWESRAVKVLKDGPSGLTHLCKKPKVRKDCMLETQPFLVYQIRTQVAALGRDGELRVQLQVVLPRMIRSLGILLLLLEQADDV